MKRKLVKNARKQGNKDSPWLAISHREARHPFRSWREYAVKGDHALLRSGSILLKPKFTISQPRDNFEQEADQMADQVIWMSNILKATVHKGGCDGIPGPIGEYTKCRNKRLLRQTYSHTDADTAPPIVHEALRLPGRSLDPSTRAFMESRFGYDLDMVRIHTDSRAAASADAINASAYTVGNHIFFSQGQYVPQSRKGKHLIAHELAHVIQSSSVVSPKRRSAARIIQRDNNDSSSDATEVSRQEIVQVVEETKRLLGPAMEQENFLKSIWEIFTETTKDKIRDIQQFLADYQQTELYLQASGKDAGDLLIAEIRSGATGKLREFVSMKVNPIAGMALDIVVDVTLANIEEEKAKKELEKQRQAIMDNEKIRISNMDATLNAVFSAVTQFIDFAKLEGKLKTWLKVFEGVLGRSTENVIRLREDEAENLQTFRGDLRKFRNSVNVEELRLAHVDMSFKFKELETELKNQLANLRMKRVTKSGGRLEVYVASYYDQAGNLEEAVLYGWTIKKTSNDKGTNEALVLLFGDGFNWRQVPVEKWLIYLSFVRIPERSPRRVMVQTIKYDAENNEIGRINAPRSGEFAIPLEVSKVTIFKGLTRRLAGRRPITF